QETIIDAPKRAWLPGSLPDLPKIGVLFQTPERTVLNVLRNARPRGVLYGCQRAIAGPDPVWLYDLVPHPFSSHNDRSCQLPGSPGRLLAQDPNYRIP